LLYTSVFVLASSTQHIYPSHQIFVTVELDDPYAHLTGMEGLRSIDVGVLDWTGIEVATGD